MSDGQRPDAAVRPVEVLHIFSQMERGGAELRTLDVMRRIEPTAFRFHYCVLSGKPGVLDRDILRLGGRLHYCRLAPSFPWHFSSLLRRNAINVVHSHVHMFSGFILLLARLTGVPRRIAHFRSSADGHATTLRRRLQRGLMRRLVDIAATDIVAVSEASMAAAWSPEWRNDPRCRVVYNGISTAAGSLTARDEARLRIGMPRDITSILHVGRMDPAKNHERVVRIFGQIASEVDTARLYLVGRSDPHIEARLRDQIEALGLGDRVELVGQRDDVPDWMDAADLMLFPSRWEGLPGTLLEAASRGLPTLASDIDVVREIIGHLPTVHMLSLTSSDPEWAHSALRILESSPAMGARERHADTFKSGPFGLDSCVAQMESLWRSAR